MNPDSIEHITSFVTETENNQILKDVQFLVDIFMRVLAGREMVIALNTCLSTINTIAQTLPETEKFFVSETLTDLAKSIVEIKIEDKNFV